MLRQWLTTHFHDVVKAEMLGSCVPGLACFVLVQGGRVNIFLVASASQNLSLQNLELAATEMNESTHKRAI